MTFLIILLIIVVCMVYNKRNKKEIDYTMENLVRVGDIDLTGIVPEPIDPDGFVSNGENDNKALSVIVKDPKFDTSKITEYIGEEIKKFEFRPSSWEEFIGQTDAKAKAQTIMAKAKRGIKAHLLVDGIKGHGKCHVKGTKILMYDGTLKNIEDIKPDDKVMGVNSNFRTVKKTGTGTGKLYEIVPTKGASFTVNGEHILSLRKTGTKQVINMSVNDYLKLPKTIKPLYMLYRVPINFKNKQLPLDPYYIGLWLGDGSSDCSRITNQDIEVWNWLNAYAKRIKLKFKVSKPENRTPYISISVSHKNTKKWNIKTELRKLNLLNNKHIPFKYKVNSRENRLKLLAGLIDSDGWLNKPNSYEILTKFDKLAEDIQYLGGSLGFLVTKKIKKVIYNNEVREYWRLSIIGDCSVIPVKISRKKAKERSNWKNPLHTGFKVKEKKKGKYYGFTLDKDHLYMIENFIVNHNTTYIELLAKDLNAKLIQRIGKQIDEDNLLDIINEINTSKEEHVLFFIDEIDTMDWKVIKILNPIIEQFKINNKKIKPFIFACATINKHILLKNNPDTLDRIPPSAHIKFKRYNIEEIAKIVKQVKIQLYPDDKVSQEVIKIIAENCKYNPRTSQALLDDYIVVKDIKKVLKDCRIVRSGLTDIDVKILKILNTSKRPMGCNAVALRCGLSPKEYEREFEPFLYEFGYIDRVPSRIISQKGKDFLKKLK